MDRHVTRRFAVALVRWRFRVRPLNCDVNMKIKSPRLLMVLFGVLLIGAVALYIGFPQEPPGDWVKSASPKARSAAWKKERKWGAQHFTPIEDTPEFMAALRNIPTRLETSLDPQKLDELRELLYENLVCRHTGDLARYRERCLRGRTAVQDEEAYPWNAKWVNRRYQSLFGETLEDDALPSAVFERFWKAEYLGKNREKRMKEVAFGTKGALITIGEIHSDTSPPLFLTPVEAIRWRDWPGAMRFRSVEMHPGKRTLSQILEKTPSCKTALVVLVVRSHNDDIWCWLTRWYLDEKEAVWNLKSSISVCSRRSYYIPS